MAIKPVLIKYFTYYDHALSTVSKEESVRSVATTCLEKVANFFLCIANGGIAIINFVASWFITPKQPEAKVATVAPKPTPKTVAQPKKEEKKKDNVAVAQVVQSLAVPQPLGGAPIPPASPQPVARPPTPPPAAPKKPPSPKPSAEKPTDDDGVLV
jgi:hypothetical protein